MTPRARYVILAPDYDPNSGGTIALHHLCHHLNTLGEEAVIWPHQWVRRRHYKSPLKRLRRRLKSWLAPEVFHCHPDLNTPVIATAQIRPSDIAVYPEVVAGNPLGASHIARWLLHRPGFHTGVVDFLPNEMFFKFADFAADGVTLPGPAQRLFIFAIDEHYSNRNQGPREGTCYLVRKWRGGHVPHRETDAVQIDGLSHREIAEVFNRCKYFYSYDEATMYSCYAAICGCISIVVPRRYPSREAWVEDNPALRFGVAYGEADIAHAVATQGELLSYLGSYEAEAVESVRGFIETTQRKFARQAVHYGL